MRCFVASVLILFLLQPASIVAETVSNGESGIPRAESRSGNETSPGLETQIEAFRNAHSQKPGDPALRKGLVNLLLKRARDRRLSLTERENLYREAADLLPDDVRVQHQWGDALFNQKDFESAIGKFEAALAVQPDHLDCLLKGGVCYSKLLRYEEGIGFFERARKLVKPDFYLLYSLGRCYAENKDHEKAIEVWEEALALADSNQNRQALQLMINRSREQLASTSGGTQEENQRFIIHYAGDSQKDIGDLTAETLETVYDQVTSDLQFRPDAKVHVIFYLTDDFYSVNQAQQWVGAIAQGIKILVPLRQGYGNPTAVKGIFAHELTHVLINMRTSGNCTTWIHEGTAMYSEFKAVNGDPSTMTSYYERLLERRIKEEKILIPLNKINLSPGLADSNDNIALLYLQSYLAIRFMTERWGISALDDLFAALGKGSHLDNALEEATGRGLSEFQEEFFDWEKSL